MAVLLVLITHVPEHIPASRAPLRPPRGAPGRLPGRRSFFVLSGYLITRILLVEANEGTPLRGFYLRRFFRIFPIYFLILAIHALLQLTPAVVWSSLYLSNYYFALTRAPSLLSHTWSLAVEEHFYLLWPALIHWATAKRRLFTCGVLAAGALAASAILVASRAPNAESLIYSGSQSRIFSLCAGSTVALLYPGRPPRTSLTLRAGLLGVGVIGVGLGLLVAHARSPWAFPINLVAFAVLSLALVLQALHAFHGSGLTAKVLTSRPLTETGRISYGLYLYHPFVYAFLFGHPALGIRGLVATLPAPLQVLLAFTAAYALAALSFKLIERPLLALAPRRPPAPDPMELRSRT